MKTLNVPALSSGLLFDLETLGTARMQTVLLTGSLIGRLLTPEDVDAIYDKPTAAGSVFANADLQRRAAENASSWAPATNRRNIAGITAVWSEMRTWPIESFEELHQSGAACRRRWFGDVEGIS